jgi:hypothetical protein
MAPAAAPATANAIRTIQIAALLRAASGEGECKVAAAAARSRETATKGRGEGAKRSAGRRPARKERRARTSG